MSTGISLVPAVLALWTCTAGWALLVASGAVVELLAGGGAWTCTLAWLLEVMP